MVYILRVCISLIQMLLTKVSYVEHFTLLCIFKANKTAIITCKVFIYCTFYVVVLPVNGIY